MDYKKIIKSRALRLRILRMLSFIPDEPMLKLQYRIKLGRRLNLKNPTRFTEKLQWYKLHYRDPRMIPCVDKYDVREYVKEKGLEEILIPCLGIYDRAEQIDWDALPDAFVMKDTLGGGGNAVVLVPDKRKADLQSLERQANGWVGIDPRQKSSGREWPYYSGRNHRIIFESYVDSPNGLIDYKFFCFHGKTAFLYVMGDREVGRSVKVSLYDREFRKLPVMRVGDEAFPDAERPANYEKMLAIAETLAQDFPHVRVDLYNVAGTVLFGELTFFNASGYMQFDPDQFDFDMGKLFELPPRRDLPEGP